MTRWIEMPCIKKSNNPKYMELALLIERRVFIAHEIMRLNCISMDKRTVRSGHEGTLNEFNCEARSIDLKLKEWRLDCKTMKELKYCPYRSFSSCEGGEVWECYEQQKNKRK
jgi:hypothetical protein